MVEGKVSLQELKDMIDGGITVRCNKCSHYNWLGECTVNNAPFFMIDAYEDLDKHARKVGLSASSIQVYHDTYDSGKLYCGNEDGVCCPLYKKALMSKVAQAILLLIICRIVLTLSFIYKYMMVMYPG